MYVKYESLVQLFFHRPHFEANELDILFEEPPGQIRARLSRWVHQQKLIQLRRKHYLLPPNVTAQPAHPLYLSSALLRPSYVSLHTALSYWGLIPEQVVRIQAITSSAPHSWQTTVGHFEYVHNYRFWGYRRETMGATAQHSCYMAYPEKAILDLFYHGTGDWGQERIKAMRFQGLEEMQIDRLQEYTERYNKTKVRRAVENFLSIHGSEIT